MVLTEVRESLTDLGKRIHIARIRNDMTQRQLADVTGIDSSTLSRIEQGRMVASEEEWAKLIGTLPELEALHE